MLMILDPRRPALLLLLTLVLCGPRLGAAQERPAPVDTTAHYAFYSHAWLNLHHTLFQWANAEARDAARRRLRVRVPERGDLSALPPDDRAAWSRAVDHYVARLAGQDLHRSDSVRVIKKRLRDVPGADPNTLPPLPLGVRSALADAMPVYRAHWWPAHDAANRAWIRDVAQHVRTHEAGLAQRLARAYDVSMPGERVRVDVGAYANWAGAYTTVRPTHVTLARRDRPGGAAVTLETLVHETTHGARFAWGLRSDLDAAFEAAGGTPPRRFWHTMLFYTAGETVRLTTGDPDYVHYGARRGLYDRSRWRPWVAALRAHWRPFLHGETSDRTAALRRVAAALHP